MSNMWSLTRNHHFYSDDSIIDKDFIEPCFERLQNIIIKIRQMSAFLNLPPKDKKNTVIDIISPERDYITDVQRLGLSETFISYFLANKEYMFRSMTKIPNILYYFGDELSEEELNPSEGIYLGYMAEFVQGYEIRLYFPESINLEELRNKTDKEIQHFEKMLDISNKKLDNDKFVNNAPEDVVMSERQKRLSFMEQLDQQKKYRRFYG